MNKAERRALWLLAEVVELEGTLYQPIPEKRTNSCYGCAFRKERCLEFRGRASELTGPVNLDSVDLCEGRTWLKID